jgi:hypothetical protein
VNWQRENRHDAPPLVPGSPFTKVNWTTTQVPLWQIDCEAFRKAEREFELRDVSTEEHRQFVLAFCGRYNWKPKQSGTTVLFLPPPPTKT